MPETAYLSEINDEYEYRGNLGKPRLVPWREQLQRVNHSEVPIYDREQTLGLRQHRRQQDKYLLQAHATETEDE